MRETRLLVVAVIMVLAAFSCSRPKGSASSKQLVAPFNLLASDLEGGKVATIEVTQVSLSREFMVAVSPQTLEKVWDYRFIVRHELGTRVLKVASTLRAAAVEQASSPGDLRWEFAFYSADDKSLGDLYFDARGRRGLVGNVPVSYSPGFLAQLRHALDLSFQTIPWYYGIWE